MLIGGPSCGTLCLLYPLFVLIRLRQLQASDHMLYQLNKYTSNSIIIGLSKKYQELPFEVT